MVVWNDIAAGGQTWAHRIRMIRQVFKIALVCSLCGSLLICALNISRMTSKENYQSVWYTGKATVLNLFDESIDVDAFYWKKVGGAGSSKYLNPRIVIHHSRKPLKQLLKVVKGSFRIGLFSFALLFGSFLFFFLLRGRQSKKKEHLSGIGVLSDLALSAKLKMMGRASDIKMGSVPLLKNSEQQHILICGTTGAGKSNCLNQLLLQIRKRGERAIIVDTTGAFVSNFYREGKDILMNPYDKRSVKWNPWAECKKDSHYEQLVNSLIPNDQHSSDFFTEAARSVIYSALRKSAAFAEKNIEEFLDLMLKKTIRQLYEQLKDTDASIHLDPAGERTTSSIISTISISLRHLRSLKHSETSFSIRDWVLSEGIRDQWLFIACQPEDRSSMKRLMSVWFSIAMDSLKARDIKDKPEKLWLQIDELQSLQKLEGLGEALAESRKYGGCIVLATQDVSQMDSTYGIHNTRTLINLCGTKLCFRLGDAEIARRVAQFFGEREFKEVQEGLSYGAHQMRDGVNLSKIEKTKLTVSPTKILELDNLEAYIKLPGKISAAKTKFKYQKMKALTKAFID